MREIRFRCWGIKEKGWIEPKYMFDVNGDGRISYAFGERYGGDGYNGEKFILCQFTGLKDKNGKEIYEGDIVQLGTDKRAYWVVEWDNRDDLPRGFAMTATYPQYLHPHVKETHIIGNIYENGELLNPNLAE